MNTLLTMRTFLLWFATLCLLITTLLPWHAQANVLQVQTVAELPDARAALLQQQLTAPLGSPSYLWWLTEQSADALVQVSFEPSAQFTEVGNLSDKNCYIAMVDTSGSMQKYWQPVQAALRTVAASVQYRLPVYGFAEAVYPIVELSDTTANATAGSFSQLMADVRFQGQVTQLFLAVFKAVEQNAACLGLRQHVVVFSDGDSEDRAYTLQQVIDRANDLAISVHTVGFGGVANTLALENLRALAQQTHGQYVQFADTDAFADQWTAVLAQHQLMGVVTIDPASLPYGTDSLTLRVDVSTHTTSTDAVLHQQTIRISDTRTVANLLRSLALATGVDNPWWLIATAGLVLVLLIGWLIRRSIARSRLAKQQRQQRLDAEERQQQQLQQMQDTIEQLQNNDPVVEDGVPYGWFIQGERQYPLVKYSTTIGRSADNDVQLDDSHVSGKHAILDFKNGQFVWTERAPTNPTKVNGVAVNGNVVIKPNDTITCGAITLTFVLA